MMFHIKLNVNKKIMYFERRSTTKAGNLQQVGLLVFGLKC